MPLDLALINGHVMTIDPMNPVVSGVAIRAGRIVAVGTDEEVRAAAGTRAEVIDLRGRTATPGLYDAHAHPMMVGRALMDIDISPEAVGSIEGIKQAIKTRATATAADGWVIGRGYDQARMTEQRYPDRHDLDAAEPDRPVFLYRACHHIVSVNSKALAL
ncbi:MAG TPA: amidohydrolase family protein, partial [Thermomicrobiales bacterium]|nr:amidohydrolase family protein [Thermomicrobiales bacterium]